MSEHKAGFISIVGKPNVGKSTLLNVLMGQKLAIATQKAQTTRHRIFGILNTEEYQMVFSDTPGIIDPAYKLQKSMMHFVDASMEDGDLVLLIVEAGQKELGVDVENRIRKSKAPKILVINKIDELTEEQLEEKVAMWKEKEITDTIVPISALNHFNVNVLKQILIDRLPVSPPYYEKDQFTDKSERFFASEIIREKIFLRYKKEIPYSCEVVVNEFHDEAKIIRIQADILVERDSQKGIIIGAKGVALKNVATAARKDMENFFGKKVFLEVFVKVKANWRNEDKYLKEFGYDQ